MRPQAILKTMIFVLFIPATMAGSQALDEAYSYKHLVAGVLNSESEPVHGEQIEGELVRRLRKELRFDFSDQGFLLLKDRLKNIKYISGGVLNDEKLEPYRGLFGELRAEGVGAAIFAEIDRVKEEYQIHGVLVSIESGKILFSTTVSVENSSLLESFSMAGRQVISQVIRAIPFEASILRRDGYRVVLDRGRDLFHSGMQIPAYTIEMKNGQILFEETGLIALTQVDTNISFGKILVERRPLEVAMNNKIRLPNTALPLISSSMINDPDRMFASTESETFEITKGRIGYIDAILGPTLVSLTTVNVVNEEETSSASSIVIPRGSLRGEIWLTSRYFASLGFGYGASTLGVTGSNGLKQSVGTKVNDFRFQVGYKLNLTAPEIGPVVQFKLGYGSEKYVFENNATNPHSNTGYSGTLIGGAISFPLGEMATGGIELNTLIFPIVSNDQIETSTSIRNVSAWDVTFKGVYSLTREVDLDGRLIFQNHGATFDGDPKVASTSQTAKGVLVGLSYYF